MIARLAGTLIESTFSEAVIDVNGVGYLVFIPLSTFDALPQPGNETVLQVNTQVREDAISLYGFATAAEKNLFEQLMTVNGVGARLALAILSSMPPASFCTAVMSNDVNIMKTIPGVGKKTAERLILEMRDKINKLAIAAGPIVTPDIPASLKDTVADTVRALESLGFKRDRITRAINELTVEMPEKDCTLENLIRNALRLLNS